MDALVPDVLNASIVFLGMELMNTPEASRNLENAVNGDVLGMDVGIAVTAGGAPEPSRRIVLPRDRIAIEIASARSSVVAEYPQPDFIRMAGIVACALENTEIEEQQATFGYNMTLVLSPELEGTAVKHIGDHLFSATSFGREDWQRVGGLGTLYFLDGHRRWTFSIEPRPRDDAQSKRFFMSINLHQSNVNLPSESDVVNTFVEMLTEAGQFMDQLVSGE